MWFLDAQSNIIIKSGERRKRSECKIKSSAWSERNYPALEFIIFDFQSQHKLIVGLLMLTWISDTACQLYTKLSVSHGWYEDKMRK